MLRKGTFVLLGLLVIGAGSSRADEAMLDQLYGDGVHAFFSGDFAGAYTQLSTAIRDGSQDPRVYYFRGLAEMRLGREPDAVADLQKGAALEATDVNGRFFVGRSLERIQGSPRMVLEQYREQGREGVFQKEQEHNRLFGQSHAQGETLLRHDTDELVPLPTERATAKNGAPAAAPSKPSEPVVDPFADPTPKAGGDKPAPKAEVEKPIEPAAVKPVEKAPEKGAVEKAVEPPPTKPAAKSGDDDPFGAAPPKTPAATAPPKTAPKGAKAPPPSGKSGDDDPFGK